MICASVVAAAVLSAEPVGLKQLLEAAEQNNLDLRLSIEQREQAESEFVVAWGALLPSVGVSGDFVHNQYETALELPPGFLPNTSSEKAVIVPLNQLDAVFTAQLPLLDTGRWVRAINSGLNRTGAAYRTEARRDDVRREVYLWWYRYAAALRVLESAKRSTEVAREQAKLQQTRAQLGAVTDLDMLRAKAEVERNIQTTADAVNLVEAARRRVQTLTLIEPPETASLPPLNLRPEAPEAELEKRVELLPGVRAADQTADIARWSLIGQQATLIPAVSAQFTERVTNASGFTGKSAQYNAGLVFNWHVDVPLFAQMAVASHQRTSADLNAELARQQARDQIHDDWNRLQAGLSKVEAAAAQVEAARRAAEVARVRYEVGAGTQIDVIAAQRDQFSAEVNETQALTELASARASLRISAALDPGVE